MSVTDTVRTLAEYDRRQRSESYRRRAHAWENSEVRAYRNGVSVKMLKPCPFCGGRAVIFQTYNNLWMVQCQDCLNGTRPYPAEYIQDAARAWNRRTAGGRMLTGECGEESGGFPSGHYTTYEVTRKYGVSRRLLYRLVKMGELSPALIVNARYYWKCDEIDGRMRKLVRAGQNSAGEGK